MTGSLGEQSKQVRKCCGWFDCRLSDRCMRWQLSQLWRSTPEAGRAPFEEQAKKEQQAHLEREAASASAAAASSSGTRPGPRPTIQPGANGRASYRGRAPSPAPAFLVDRHRPSSGLKASAGAKGGGGTGKRLQVDASKEGRIGRVSKAAAREVAATRARGVSLQEKAALEAAEAAMDGASAVEPPSWSERAATFAGQLREGVMGLSVPSSVPWPLRALGSQAKDQS